MSRPLPFDCPTCGSPNARVMFLGCHETIDPWHRAQMLEDEAAAWDDNFVTPESTPQDTSGTP